VTPIAIIEHVHDADFEAFRVTLAEEVWEDQDGENVLVGYGPEHTVLFAADDERWDGMQPGEIAQTQRDIVAQQLANNAYDAEIESRRRAATITELPNDGSLELPDPVLKKDRG
jgi:hypothetical protein